MSNQGPAELDLEPDHTTSSVTTEDLFLRLDAKIGQLAVEARALRDAMAVDRLERRLAKDDRWLFVAWASLLLPIMGLWLRR